MSHPDRVKKITQILQESFSPLHLTVIDDSEKHKGHPGNTGDAGHYTIFISAIIFKNMSRVEVHRAIYAALHEMIPDEIHALSIQVNNDCPLKNKGI